MVSIHIRLATGRKATQTRSHLDATETLEKGRSNVLTPLLRTKNISIASYDPGRYWAVFLSWRAARHWAKMTWFLVLGPLQCKPLFTSLDFITSNYKFPCAICWVPISWLVLAIIPHPQTLHCQKVGTPYFPNRTHRCREMSHFCISQLKLIW